MLDCLDELFKEHGEEVMPKDLAERMEQKLHSIYITILPHTYIHHADL